MAKAVINLQKESGGIVKISPADGTGVTELVVPESGNLVSVGTAVTDNAIARYDGTTGKLQNSGVIIGDNGNVGIGTNNPVFKVDVLGESGNGYRYSNGTTGVTMGVSVGRGQIGTTTSDKLELLVGSTPKAVITPEGNLLVGTSVDNGVDKLQVSGSIGTDGSQYNIWSNIPVYEIINRGSVAKTFQWYIGAYGSAPIASLTSSGVWTNASDKRNKTNIKDMSYGLDTVMRLSPKEYDLKSDGTHAIGFIAQDVKEIIPELVFGKTEEEFLTLDYASMVAVLVKAIQEQQIQINQLQGKQNVN